MLNPKQLSLFIAPIFALSSDPLYRNVLKQLASKRWPIVKIAIKLTPDASTPIVKVQTKWGRDSTPAPSGESSLTCNSENIF
jgi:hypothetical protein